MELPFAGRNFQVQFRVYLFVLHAAADLRETAFGVGDFYRVFAAYFEILARPQPAAGNGAFKRLNSVLKY